MRAFSHVVCDAPRVIKLFFGPRTQSRCAPRGPSPLTQSELAPVNKFRPPRATSDANDHFAIGLVGFHRLVCLANIVELKDSGRFRLIDSCGRFIHDGLQRNVRDWKVRRAEYKAAKK